ncbi:MAG: potassium channel family protein [Rhodothermales bacterium]
MEASKLVNTHVRTASRLTQINQARREILLASIVLALLLVTGTVGYMLIEGWSWADGLYMTFITLTTIGFGEIQPLATGGRFFTIIIAVVGIGTVAFVATRAAQLVLESASLQQRQTLRTIKTMHDHYIICGTGRIGRRIAADLQHAGKSFVAIDREDEKLEMLKKQGVPTLVGDAEDEEILLQAGIERAAGLITLLPEDSSNIFVTLVARELNPTLFILSRTNHVKNRRKLLQAGAAKVIAPTDVGADRMAQVILRPNVDQFMEQVLKTTTLSLQMEEVCVEAGAPLAGKSLAQSHFRQQFDAIVIAIIDAESGEMKFNPGPHDVLNVGDVLIVLGSEEMIYRLLRKGCMAQ